MDLISPLYEIFILCNHKPVYINELFVNKFRVAWKYLINSLAFWAFTEVPVLVNRCKKLKYATLNKK